jgi:predicted RNA-binding Zn ribbon-like protein
MTFQPQGIEHDHEIDLDGALDFINTLDLDDGQLVEHFQEPSDAVAWLLEHRLLHPTEAYAWTPSDLEHVKAVRAGLRDVVDSVVLERLPAPESLRLVNETLEMGPRPHLDLEGGEVRVGHRHVASPASEALVPIAHAIVAELASGRPERFRICANDRCQWTFFDASPTGRRRWCDMRTCGNRAKAARHRERIKAQQRTEVSHSVA